jgi:hypothetical protein
VELLIAAVSDRESAQQSAVVSEKLTDERSMNEMES